MARVPEEVLALVWAVELEESIVLGTHAAQNYYHIYMLG
jgi:hypothetical protein